MTIAQWFPRVAAAAVISGLLAAPAAADTLTGTAGPDVLTGAIEATTVNAGGGADRVYGDPMALAAANVGVQRINTNASAGQGTGGQSLYGVMADDGSKVIFTSQATFDGVSPTGTWQLYIKDLATGALSLVSTSAAGVRGNGTSWDGIFAPGNGRIVFESSASNLIAGDTNAVSDVYIKDLATGAVTRISTAADGSQGNAASFGPAEFSPDGTRVLFASSASNLVPGDTNGGIDLFIKTLATGAITRVSTTASGGQINGIVHGNTWNGRFSPTGDRIVFVSTDATLVPGDTNGTQDIFVKSLTTGAVSRVSTTAAGAQVFASPRFPVFSPDGTAVAFASNEQDGSGNGGGNGGGSGGADGPSYLCCGNGFDDVFLKNLVTGAVTRVSVDATGTELLNLVVAEPSFSPDGTKIVFMSQVLEIPGPSLNRVFMKDLRTGALAQVATPAAGGLANDHSTISRHVFDASGLRAVFFSNATNLVGGDTNATTDIFLAALPSAGGGADVLNGEDGDDQLFGGAGDDTLVGGPGNDRLSGKIGVDVAVFSGPRHRYAIETLSTDRFRVTDLLVGAPDGVDTTDGVELAKFGAATPLPWDQLPPPNRTPVVTGSTLLTAFEDLATPGVVPIGDPDGDALTFTVVTAPARGTLSLDAASGHYVYTANGNGVTSDLFQIRGQDFLGASITAEIDVTIRGLTLIGTPGDDTLVGGDAADEIIGDDGDDELSGGGSADRLSGDGGDDMLDGGPGADEMIGGPGNDVYVVDHPGDRVIELPNQGFDTVLASRTYKLPANVEACDLSGTGNFIVRGNDLNNRLKGNAGKNALFGGNGDDLFIASPGADRHDGSEGFDTVSYVTSNAPVKVDIGAGKASGGYAAGDRNTGMDALIGSRFNDELTGDKGFNEITGGRGADRLRGGTGLDVFIYTAVADSTPAKPDRILDFSVKEKDKIDLSPIDANSKTAGKNDAFTFIGSKRFSRKPGQARFAGGRLEADVNGDGKADLVVLVTIKGSFSAANLIR